MPKAPVSALRICKITADSALYEEDLLVTEEPLAIRLAYSVAGERLQRDLAITMRTPGNDRELTLGFLFCEGLIQKPEDVYSIRDCPASENPHSAGNTLKVNLAEHVLVPAGLFQRYSFISSSCGICGKTSLDSITAPVRNISKIEDLSVSAKTILEFSDAVIRQQRVFVRTGGIHAAALFDKKGTLLGLMEDIGRHNAVDKLIGMFFERSLLPLNEAVLFLSGRASFELLQKAAMAGLQIVCAVGAPSSLAVECALKFHITLIGFLRPGRFNIYSGQHRIHCNHAL